MFNSSWSSYAWNTLSITRGAVDGSAGKTVERTCHGTPTTVLEALPMVACDRLDGTDREPASFVAEVTQVVDGSEALSRERLTALYGDEVEVPVTELPSATSATHTMAHELDRYVSQRVPAAELRRAAIEGVPVHVLGVYPSHLPLVAAGLGFRIHHTVFWSDRRDRRVNSVRPTLHVVTDRARRRGLVLSVPPGRDYLIHYASLVRHVLARAGAAPLTVVHYPEAERRLTTWTGLGRDLLGPTPSAVVLGKVDLMETALASNKQAAWTGVTDYYRVRRYLRPSGGEVVLLGVHFSYWGALGGRIAVRCCELGASDIVYVGKLGALTSPEDLYARVFVPARYALIERSRVSTVSTGPPNPLLSRFPSLRSGLHVSVPTVLEEDHTQHGVAVRLGAHTLDNEIAGMAVAVERWNRRHDATVGFSALHYATDYLRGPAERARSVRFSLATGRSPAAARGRLAATRLITDCLREYLFAPPARSRKAAPTPLAGGRAVRPSTWPDAA